jgi:hypothetical protein
VNPLDEPFRGKDYVHPVLTEGGDPYPDADAWRGGVSLNRVARFLFESAGGVWWNSVELVSQEERSRFFAMARRLLAVGAPLPLLAEAHEIREAFPPTFLACELLMKEYSRRNGVAIAALSNATAETLASQMNTLAHAALTRLDGDRDARRLEWFERADREDRGLGGGLHVLRHVELREVKPGPPCTDAADIEDRTRLFGVVQWVRIGDAFEVRTLAAEPARSADAGSEVTGVPPPTSSEKPC